VGGSRHLPRRREKGRLIRDVEEWLEEQE